MFSLTSINLTNIGWAGGSTSTNWTRYFSSEAKAKIAAEKDYGHPLTWTQEKPRCKCKCNETTFQTTGDLGHVMYEIKEITPE